ncbi:hypothetical protein C0Q70_01983 [Pomacea canaliculata]|uniref:Uncharacterized protein n=1 Tax=Pomacea canaliculata TaxID=400727 RepID=A0A2T7Q107_POMCA|nr:hypothetical protein C0Q70_01983 [Pomacea canaliculata]
MSYLPASVIILALGMAGHLVTITPVPDSLWQVVTALYEAVLTCNAVSNSSVGAAYFNTHIFTGLTTLETAQSVFLQMAAENFLVTWTTLAMETVIQDLIVDHQQQVTGVVHKVLECLTRSLKEMKLSCPGLAGHSVTVPSVSSSHVTVSQIFQRLSSVQEFCQWKVQDVDFMKTIAVLSLHHSSAKIRQLLLQTLLHVYNYMQPECQTEFLNKTFLHPLLCLVKEGHVEKGLEIATAVLDSGVSLPLKAIMTLQDLQQLPHDVLLGRQLHEDESTPSATAALCNVEATTPTTTAIPSNSAISPSNILIPATLIDATTASGTDSTTDSQDVSTAALSDSVTAALSERRRLIKLTPCILRSLKQKSNSLGITQLLGSGCVSMNDAEWPVLVSRWPQGIGPVVVNNAHLVTSLLQLLQDSDCPALSLADNISVMESLLLIMGRSQLDSKLYSQTGAAFLATLNQVKKMQSILDSRVEHILEGLMVQLERHLVAIQWEVRDTALEIIRSLIQSHPEPWLQKVMQAKNLLPQAWACIQDGESYTRASAINLASALRSAQGWWQCFLEGCKMTETMIVKKVIEVLEEDTEAFARRSAVEFLSTVFASSSDCVPLHFVHTGALSDLGLLICSALGRVLEDFDWEVKVKALRFWERAAMPVLGRKSGNCDADSSRECDGAVESTPLHEVHPHKRKKIDSNIPIHRGLHVLLRAGFGEALCAGLEDYDSSVKELAFSILLRFRDHLQTLEDYSPPKAARMDVGCADQCASFADLAQSTNRSFTHKEYKDWDHVEAFLNKTQSVIATKTSSMFETSADEYEQRPSSLLEDIMAAIKMAQLAADAAASSEDEFDNGEDIFVDCY